jgi:PAS domain S-box-containing protein
VADYLWLEPIYSFRISGSGSWISLATFVCMGILISALVESTYRAADAEHRERTSRERERRFFESALRSITDAFVVLDENWRYTYINEVAEKMMRLPAEKIVGHHVFDLLPDIRDSDLHRQLLLSREKNKAVQFEYYYAPFNLWTEIRAYPMPGGTALYIVDITPRKKIQADLSEAQSVLQEHAANLEQTVAERTAKLQETIAELERFSYTISHDLRAPLRAMESFSGFVVEDYGDRLDDQGREYLERIRGSAQRMDALIRDVLVYSQTARADLKIEPVDLDSLTNQVLTQYGFLNNPANRIEIRAPLGSAFGNATMLSQVFSNLIQNALKFIKPGQPPHILIWTERDQEHVRIHIRDNGIGIPVAAREKIFGIFEQAHGGGYEGTGIGLAIVKRAVERMFGKVGVQSEPGKGSTFWIELPTSPAPSGNAKA